MRIAMIAKPDHENTGVGRYTRQLCQALEADGHEVLLVHPIVPLPGVILRALRHLLGWDLVAFFNNFPVWARYPPADIYHITSQNLATLILLRRPPGKVVVTVHDIIPWLAKRDRDIHIYQHRFEDWFDRLAIAGLRRADKLISVTNYTKSTLIDNLSFRADSISVVHEGVS